MGLWLDTVTSPCTVSSSVLSRLRLRSVVPVSVPCPSPAILWVPSAAVLVFLWLSLSSTPTLRSPPRKATWLASRVWSWASPGEKRRFSFAKSSLVLGWNGIRKRKREKPFFPPLCMKRGGQRKAVLYQHFKVKIESEKNEECASVCYGLFCISIRRLDM